MASVPGREAPPSAETVRAWKTLRWRRAAWRSLACLGSIILTVVALLAGDSLGPGDDLPSARVTGSPPERGANSPSRLSAGLVVRRLRGWPAARQEEVVRKLAIRLRGPAATMRGKLYVSSADLVWIPDRAWLAIGARDVLVPWDDVVSAQLVGLGRRSGVTIYTRDGSEIWLWLGRQVSGLDQWHPR
jgi:hypothetical protein